METKDLYFDLPPELIAQYPSDKRGEDRLMTIDRRNGKCADMMFCDLPDLLEPGSLLVLNESKVRKARVFARSRTGGKVELLFLSPESGGTWRAVANRIKRRKPGEILRPIGSSDIAGSDGFEQDSDIRLEIEAVHDDGTLSVRPDRSIGEDFFQAYGHVPLPPYIKREDAFLDESRYQTVYARTLGSVASPTAGLHYTDGILDRIRQRGVKISFITLHVGMGTFLPIRCANVEDHVMHSEDYEISAETAEAVNASIAAKTPVIASGTTSLRCLESAFDPQIGKVMPGAASTNIFITPGYSFKVVNKLVTNFHTPYSTLMALVSAFSSLDIVKSAYARAVEKGYRFFSYGDATYWH